MITTTQKIQGGDQQEVTVRCYCGEDLYLVISQFEWGKAYNYDVEYHVHIEKHPSLLRDRIKSAWQALRGKEYPTTSYVMLTPEQLKDLVSALKKLKPLIKKEG